MKLVREIYCKVINLLLEGQKKVLNFVKELNQEFENKKIDDVVERFIRKYKNVLIEFVKR